MTAAAVAEATDELRERVVLLIDLSSLFWAAWHSSGEEEVSAARRRTLDAVQRCIGDFPHRLIAICCDSGRSFRKNLSEDYKANRPEKDLQVLRELDLVKEALRDAGHLLWAAKDAEGNGFEADDVIATACTEAVRRGHAVVIASADKDLLQLLKHPGVKQLRTHNFEMIDREGVIGKFGVPPEQLGDWLAMVGDNSDNIRGIPSVGPKTATSLIAKHGSLGALLLAVQSSPATAATPAVVRAIEQNTEVVILARKLVELRTDAPIDFEQLYATRPSKQQQKPAEEQDMDTPDPELVDKAAPPVAAPPAANGTAPKTNGATLVPETAMTVLPPHALPFELALEPTSLGVAFKLAERLWDSRLYSRFPSAEAIAAVILRGRELGVPAIVALDLFHVIEGKPCPTAHFLISLAERDPNCEYFTFVGGDATYAEYETKHRKSGRVTTFRYTVEDAINAGYCKAEIEPRDWNAKDGKDHRGPWDKLRPSQIRKTCGVQLARLIYPTAILGLYAYEEMGGEVA